jgi:hypothetical protein
MGIADAGIGQIFLHGKMSAFGVYQCLFLPKFQ